MTETYDELMACIYATQEEIYELAYELSDASDNDALVIFDMIQELKISLSGYKKQLSIWYSN